MELFLDRREAGRLIAVELADFKGKENVIVLGLARGGVAVAYEVAEALQLPLNVVVPRKIGAPTNPELALGSIMEDGEGVFNHTIIHALGVPISYIEHEIEKEKARAQHRLALYRRYAPLPGIRGKAIILVDDGIATGSTMLTAIQAMKREGAGKVVVAVPVSSTDAYEAVSRAADEVFCLHVRDDFMGVGMFYTHFDQTNDDEVVEFLKKRKPQS